MHPAAMAYAAGADAAGGAAAAARDRAKRAHYALAGIREAYEVMPMSIEHCGRLGKPGMGLLQALADVAASWVGCKSAFRMSTLRQLSVPLGKGNGRMYRSPTLRLPARVGGQSSRKLLVPVSYSDSWHAAHRERHSHCLSLV
jgi:hypothetical protein